MTTYAKYACVECGANDIEDECECGKVCQECDRPAPHAKPLCSVCEFIGGGLKHSILNWEYDLAKLKRGIPYDSNADVIAALAGLIREMQEAYGTATGARS